MASLPLHNAELSRVPSSDSPFGNSTVHGHLHYQQSPLTCPSFQPTSFEHHLQPPSFRQGIHGEEFWQTPAMHPELLSQKSSSDAHFEGFAQDNCGSPIFARYGISHQSFAGMATGHWDEKLVRLLACGNGIAGNPITPTVHAHMPEGGSLAEMIADVGVKGRTASINGFTQALQQNDKLFSHNMGVLNNLSVDDPSKRDLAVQVNAEQTCTHGFTTSPMFADKFPFLNEHVSMFSSAAELSQTVGSHIVGNGGNLIVNPNKLAKVGIQEKVMGLPSGLGTSPSSTLNSPNTSKYLLQDAIKPRQEILANITPAKVDSHAILEEHKMAFNKKPSLLPTLVEVDGSEGMIGMQCTSVDESDESMSQEVSSSFERDGGRDGASHGKICGKNKRTKNRSKNDAAQLSNFKGLEREEMNGKRHKGEDDVNEDKKLEHSNDSGDSMPTSVKESSKPTELPKPDYIHVRARRGQATDSHSLAERIRREKISERMKFLQDLVPGCSKITGKAVMLDEIINYVQSLQRQVEFLSMKLAAVNPRVEFNMESLFRRDMIQPRVPSHQPPLMFSVENPLSYTSLHRQQPQAPLQMVGHGGVSRPSVDAHCVGGSDTAVRATPVACPDGYGDSISQQVSQTWDEELQNVVHMSFAQGRQTSLASPTVQGQQLYTGLLKAEL